MHVQDAKARLSKKPRRDSTRRAHVHQKIDMFAANQLQRIRAIMVCDRRPPIGATLEGPGLQCTFGLLLEEALIPLRDILAIANDKQVGIQNRRYPINDVSKQWIPLTGQQPDSSATQWTSLLAA